MSDFDAFSGELLEESKRFLEKAAESSDHHGRNAYLHASLMLALSALEARINSIAEVQAKRTDLSVHERGLLLEQEVYLQDGEFQLSNKLKMWRLDERVEFLCVRLSGKALDKSRSWWGQLIEAIRLRNELTHPKAIPEITELSVSNALKAIINAFDELSQAIYRKRYPGARRGLTTKLQF
jgi:hypothetical protein